MNSLLQVYEVLSVCTVATTYYNTMSGNYEEIKSSVPWFSPIKFRKPTLASDLTHYACARDMLHLGQSDPGSWDVESAYSSDSPSPLSSDDLLQTIKVFLCRNSLKPARHVAEK